MVAGTVTNAIYPKADGIFDKVVPLAKRIVAADMERVVNVSPQLRVSNNR